MIETTLVGLSTLLGPSLLQCRRCGRLLLSHRREWADRTARGKAWYVNVSLVYVVGLAAFAYLLYAFACSLARYPSWRLPAVGAALVGTATAALQAYRVARSLRRTRPAQRAPQRPSFWNLDWCLPQKVFAVLALSTALLAWALRIASSPDG
jgi:hypothetical protein